MKILVRAGVPENYSSNLFLQSFGDGDIKLSRAHTIPRIVTTIVYTQI